MVTGESFLDLASAANEPVLSVLIPTSPMPFTGFTITVLKSETIDINISIEAGLRAGTDLRNEKISYKVREHSHAKVPVLLAVGQREVETGMVALRRLGSREQRVLSLDETAEALVAEVSARGRQTA
jgi:threonyl-tRNA synthetase